MGKYIISTTLLLAVMVFASCDDYDYKTPDQTLFVVESDLDFTSLPGEGKITVKSEGTVKATSDAGWCKPTVSGNTVKVSVEENFSGSNRTALVTIESGTERQLVPVTQPGLLFFIDNREIESPWTPNTIKIEVISERPLTIEYSDTWFDASLEDGILSIRFDGNLDYDNPRSGTIDVSYEHVVIEIEVTQGGRPQGGLFIDDFVGDYDMDVAINANTAVPVVKPVTLRKVSETELILSGMTDYDLIVDYNPYRGILELYPQNVSELGDNFLRLCPWHANYMGGGGTLYAWGVAVGQETVWNDDYNNFELTWVDAGNYALGIYGFTFWEVTSALGSVKDSTLPEAQKRFAKLRMVKK